MVEDTEFEPKSAEELLNEEQEAELRRKIRREVRRIRSGEAEEEMRQEEEQERLEQEQQHEEEVRQQKKRSSWLWLMISGMILVRSGVSQYYRYALCIAVMFFVSIIVIFNALRVDKKYSQVEVATQELREYSLRLHERRLRQTSRRAITARLRERGIEMCDAGEDIVIMD